MTAPLPYHKISHGDINNGIYVGNIDMSKFAGFVELVENLGMVTFEGNVSVLGGITAKHGSGIKTTGDLICESYIRSDLDILCGGRIDATHDLKTRGNIIAVDEIKGSTIKAKGSIKSGGKIITSEEINCKGTVYAGEGIEFRLNIFARNGLTYGNSDCGIIVTMDITAFDKAVRAITTRKDEVGLDIR